MKYLVIILLLFNIIFSNYRLKQAKSYPVSDSERIVAISYVLDAVKEKRLNTSTIFHKFFDQERGGPTSNDQKGYHDWLNLYLSQVVDTLSEKDVEKLSILAKRILCHKIYFQDLKERLGGVAPPDIQIFPYSAVKDPDSFDRGYIVHENDAPHTYVITYPYRGGTKAEYVLFGEGNKIRSMARVEEQTGLVIGSFMFL